MFDRLFDPIGNANPQLFRELKGRLRPRNVLIAIGGSLFVQTILFFIFWSKLPVDRGLAVNVRNDYCISGRIPELGPNAYGCLRDSFDRFIIQWDSWWWELCQSLTLLWVGGLLLAGLFLLIGNLADEKQRGTLNFVRLSPQSARTILMGKLIGVPVLVYIAVAAALPLHVWSALNSGGSPIDLVLFYSVVFASCMAFFCLAIFYALLSGQRPWLGFVLASIGTIFYLGFLKNAFLHNFIDTYKVYCQAGNCHFEDIRLSSLNQPIWWFIPLAKSPTLTQLFIVLSCTLVIYWVWSILERHYHNPKGTFISKGQSYGLTLCVNLYLLGFAASSLVRVDYPIWQILQRGIRGQLSLYICINLGLILLLTILVMPSRQALQDWSRHRHLDRNYSEVRDLLWGEKSPATMTVRINIIAIATIWSVWILLWPQDIDKLRLILGIFICAALMLIYSTILQWISFLKHPKRSIFAAVSLAAMLCIPLVIVWPIVDEIDRWLTWGVFSIFSAGIILVDRISLLQFCLCFVGQVAIAAAFASGFLHHVKQTGKSEMKLLVPDTVRLRT
ncbi:MAG: hypothetical protein J7642_18395 [Cyanobacteria bacterium SBC]|nr:hypothetical protein [Cyanobacteria bacterium SBC]